MVKIIRNQSDFTINLYDAPLMVNDILLIQINVKDILKFKDDLSLLMLSDIKMTQGELTGNNHILIEGIITFGSSLIGKTLSELNYRLYIPHLNNDEKLKEKYYKILSGNLRNSWVDQYNKKLFCNKRIIKEIRINQSLKWVKLNFPEIPIICGFVIIELFNIEVSLRK